MAGKYRTGVRSNKSPRLAKQAAPNDQVVKAHFNSVNATEVMDGIAAAHLTGAPMPLGISQGTADALLKRVKTIEAPPGCPSDHDEWRQEISRLLGIAVFKMASRLAQEGDTMALASLPVATAVLVDKRLLLTGQPTSYDFRVNATITHETLLKRINGEAKP